MKLLFITIFEQRAQINYQQLKRNPEKLIFQQIYCFSKFQQFIHARLGRLLFRGGGPNDASQQKWRKQTLEGVAMLF